MTNVQFSGIIRTIIVMSLSGSALALILFALKPIVCHRLPKSVQYCLWLVALAALLIPVSKLIIMPETQSTVTLAPIHTAVERNIVTVKEEANRPPRAGANTQAETAMSSEPPSKTPALAATAIFMTAYPWVGLAVLLYNILCYILFTKKMRRHRTRARKDELYEHIGLCGGANPPRLYRSAFAATPMLIGIFRPEIILPDREYTGVELQSILRHELTHFNRRDIVIKWLSAFACALHWFNPIVWLMRREIDRTCELSCDEAVIRNLDLGGKRNYGNTLISVAADVREPRTVLSMTMCAEKETLKERLNAIMNYQRRGQITVVFSTFIIAMAFCVVCVLGAGANASSVDAQAVTSTTVVNQPVNVDAKHLSQLRENAVEVSSAQEFTDALKKAQIIVLKKDITLDDVFISLSDINVLIIEEGVTLTITSLNFYPDCEIINFGEILVDDTGRILFYHEPNDSHIGKVSIKGKYAEIGFCRGKIGADEIAYYLAEGSLYNALNIVAGSSDGEPVEILIDHDIVIPAGKTLWLNAESVLHVQEGATLTNNGTITGYNKPIIDGTINGMGKLLS